MILLDLSKDVDSIDHLILFRKLQLISVSMDSFKSYLSDRTHCVRTGSTTSQAHTVTRGASQGSILGSLLLNIYINDVPNVTKEPRLESYVDDSKIFLSFPIVDAESAARTVRGYEQNKYLLLFEQSVSQSRQNQVPFNRHAANVRAIAGKISHNCL